MKKILLTVAVAAAIMTVGCSTAADREEKAEQSLQYKIENCTNPDSLKIYVEQAKSYAAKLASEGKLDEARKYLDDITPAIDKAAPSLKQQWNSAVEAIKGVTVNAADSVADAVSDKYDEAKSGSKDVVDKVVDGTKEVAGKVKDGSVETYEKVKEGSKDAYDKAKEGTEKLLDKAK